MSKLLVLASGVVREPVTGEPAAVSAYVVLSAGPRSRIFRVRGAAGAPSVEELPAATTLDVRRFQTQLQEDLQPALDELRAKGHPVHVELTRLDWVATVVGAWLREREGTPPG